MEEGVTIGKLLQRAMENDLTLEIEYAKNHYEKYTPPISDVTISDECGIGYISACCHMREEQRTFKMSRIVDARIVPSYSKRAAKQLFNYEFDVSKPIFNLYGETF